VPSGDGAQDLNVSRQPTVQPAAQSGTGYGSETDKWFDEGYNSGSSSDSNSEPAVVNSSNVLDRNQAICDKAMRRARLRILEK